MKIKLFDLIKCFCESEGDRCDCCAMKRAAIGLPNGIKENAECLLSEVLEPVSELYGKPMKVERGFLCPTALRSMKWSRLDPHVTGEEADICAVDLQGNDLRFENLEIARAVVKNGKWNLMVLEDVTGTGIEPKMIHVSYKRGGVNQKKILKKVEGEIGCQVLSELDLAQLFSSD